MSDGKSANEQNSEPKIVSEDVVEKILDLTVNPELINPTNSIEETNQNLVHETESVVEKTTKKAEDETKAVVEETTEEAKAIVEETTEEAKAIVEETTEKVESVVEETTEEAKAVVEETTEKVESVVEETKEEAEAVVEETTEKVESVVEETKAEAEAEIKLKIEKINDTNEKQIQVVEKIVETEAEKVVEKVSEKVAEKVEESATHKVKEIANTINVKSFKNNDVTKNLEVSDKIYHLVKDNIRGFDFDNTNVVILVTKVMTITGKVSTLTGMEKKGLVLSICERILEEDTSINKEDQKFIHLTLHSLVDLMVDVSKGKLKLNNKLSKKKKAVVPRLPPGQIIDSVIDKLKTIIKNRKYSCQEIIVNLSIITGMVMTIIEQYPYLSGIEKKNIVIQVLKRLIKKELPNIVKVSDENQVMINLALETLPNIIDTLIGVSSGKVKVNEQTVTTGCLALFSCLKNRNTKKKENVKALSQENTIGVVEAPKTTEAPETNEDPKTTEAPENIKATEPTETTETNISEVKNVDEVELVVDGTLTEKKKAFLDKTDGLVVDRLNEAIDSNPYSKNNTKTLKEDDTQNENSNDSQNETEKQSNLSVV